MFKNSKILLSHFYKVQVDITIANKKKHNKLSKQVQIIFLFISALNMCFNTSYHFDISDIYFIELNASLNN